MNGVKLIIISAEISALICLAILLYMSVKNNEFDYVRAAFSFMFAIVAVMLQSIQDGIKWRI